MKDDSSLLVTQFCSVIGMMKWTPKQYTNLTVYIGFQLYELMGCMMFILPTLRMLALSLVTKFCWVLGWMLLKSPNPTGCYLLLMEWMLWTHKQQKNLTVLLGYQFCWLIGWMLWSPLTLRMLALILVTKFCWVMWWMLWNPLT